MLKTIQNYLKNEEYKRLFDNFMSLMTLQGLNYILPLVTFPYLVRVLGTEKFGLISFATAFINYFIIITDYGFSLSATREIAINRDTPEKISEIFSSVMIVKFILMILSFLILVLIVYSIDRFRVDSIVYMLTFGMVLGNVLFPTWFFQGMEKMRYITVVNIISRIFFTLAIFLVVRSEQDYVLVPLLNSLGAILGGLISLYVISKTFNQRIRLYDYNTLKKHFIDSSQFFLSRASVSIYTSSNAFVLGIFTNNVVVGNYAIAEKLYTAIQSAYAPIVQVLYPYISKQRDTALFNKIFKIVVFLNSLLIVLLMIYGQDIFNMLFTTSVNSDSLLVFYILLIALLSVVPSILLGYPYLAALGHPKSANMSVIFGSIFHLVGLGILIITDNIILYYIAVMVLLTETFVLILRIYWVKKYLYNKVSHRFK